MSDTGERPAESRRGLPWTHRRPRLHRFLNRGLAGLVVFFAVAEIWLWGFFKDPVYGLSAKYFVTYGIVVLSTVLGLPWFFFCSRFDRRWVRSISCVLVAALVALIGSVRRIDQTGDVSPAAIEWRWQPTADERFEQYRSKLAPVGAAQDTFPAADGSDGDDSMIATEADMPGYRGAARDGILIGPPLNSDWKSHPPRILWKHPVGGGYSQLAVVGNYAVTMEQRRDQEAVVCYDATTGRERWAALSPGRFEEALGGPGPRSTPAIADGRVYALGGLGRLACLNLQTGQVVWARDLLSEFKLAVPAWAITSSPLPVGDMVVVNLGGYYGGGLVAVDRATGADLWSSAGLTAIKDHPPPLVAAALQQGGEAPPEYAEEHAEPGDAGNRNRSGYASPMLATIDGARQILNFDGLGLWGHSLDDGTALWFHHFENSPGVNAAQPIVCPDGRILISASYSMGCRLLQVSKERGGWRVEALWGLDQPNLKLRSKMSSPVFVGGYVYGLDEGILVCIDPATGDRRWKGSREVESTGRYGHGQLLVHNGLILLLTEGGDIVLVRPQPDKLVELGTLHVLDGPKTWNAPALARGRLYIRNHVEMACVDLCAGDDATRTTEAIPVGN